MKATVRGLNEPSEVEATDFKVCRYRYRLPHLDSVVITIEVHHGQNSLYKIHITFAFIGSLLH